MRRNECVAEAVGAGSAGSAPRTRLLPTDAGDPQCGAATRPARIEAPGEENLREKRAAHLVSELPATASRPALAALPSASRALCVSIHDVAPATWTDCLRLLEALREVAPELPLTWLIVPRYHGQAPDAPSMDEALTELAGGGHELALHGYTHVDTAARQPGLRNHFIRNVYTTGEGEFAAIDEAEALERIDLGLAWFAERHWPVHGFVPPAWLTSPGARRALQRRPFAYSTSITHFHFLPSQRRLWSPSLMYTARQAAGRWFSPHVADAAALALARNPLVRFGLHPADARHPALLRHAQAMLERLLSDRIAMTKHQFAVSYSGGLTDTASTQARP